MHCIQNQERQAARHFPVSCRRQSADLGVMRIVEEQAGDHPDCLFFRQDTAFDIPFKIFFQKRIQRTQRTACIKRAIHRLEMC